MAQAHPAQPSRRPSACRRGTGVGLWAACLAWLALATGNASAQATIAALGTAPSGLRGLIHTGLPVSPREVNLSLAAGYGVTEAFDPVPGAHHRAQGSIGAAITPLAWLNLALRLDGRLEAHPDDFDGAHSAGFGDPRVFARAGKQLNPKLALGFELGLWFPGNRAPSLVLSATSVDARGLVAFTPENSPWVLLGALGFRLDNSAEAAPDLNRLRLGDRISLGLSSYNALPLALGLARRLDSAELFGELSADFLVGSHAPALSKSPLRAALGARYFLKPSWQIELTASTSLSARPEVSASDPLVPIEPRFSMLFAVRYGIALDPPPPLEAAPRRAATQPSVPQPTAANVSGVLLDDKGEPLPEATVKLQSASGEVQESITDARGQYTFAKVAVGPASLEASAQGCETQSWQIDVQPKLAALPARTLASQVGHGLLRGLTRSFHSEPLQAQISVRDRRGRVVANRTSGTDGAFEIELQPGQYRVTISAPGYVPHSRSVQIAGNAVSILNVDMHEQP